MKNQSTPLPSKADDDIDELENQLRINYQKYLQEKERGLVELKSQAQIGHGACKLTSNLILLAKTIKHFYVAPKISLLEDPDKQKAFRNKFISDVSETPEPEPLVLLGDVLHL